MLETVETLEATKKYLQKHGWIQGKFYYKQSACLMGAINAVVKDSEQRIAATTAIRRVWDMAPETMIIEWNDKEGRTEKEVIALIDKAIESEKANG